MPTKETVEESNSLFQLSGLSSEKKKEIKLEAIKRNVSASQLLVEAYDEYVRRHPASS